MRLATHLCSSNPPVYMCHDVNNQRRIQKVCDSASVTHRGWECEMNVALYNHRHINVRSLSHEGWHPKCITRKKKNKKQHPRANTRTVKHKREHRAVSNPSGRKEGKKTSKVKKNKQKRGVGGSFNQKCKTFHINNQSVFIELRPSTLNIEVFANLD